MTNYKRGDVVLVIFPHSDRIHYKKRPALVVQDETVDTRLGQRIVVAITTNLARIGPTRLSIKKDSPEGRSMGLLDDSVVMADNIQTVQPFMIDRAIGSCPSMARVGTALRCALGL
jgi:mRNA interferase MazF